MISLITSSSYLLPSNNIWSEISKLTKIEFGNYGNLFHKESKKKYDFEINIIFLKDIINYYLINNKKNFNSEKFKINTLINQISFSTKNKETKYIIGLSSFFYKNIIYSSKNKTLVKKIYDYFIDNLYEISKKNNNLFILDLDFVFAQEGFKNCFENRNYYSFKCHLSEFGLKLLDSSLSEVIIREEKPRKKILLLDCDNTIWGGVLGEDGFDKIQLGNDGIGSAFVDFQKATKKLKNEGILIGLVSKNEEGDVLNVLKNHRSMIIKNKDVTIMKINWNEKFKNIKEISKELSLGLNSFVFWDDNPIEREKIKINLKDVEVIEPDEDVANWPKQLLEYQGFSKFEITKDDQNKSRQYKMRSEFIKNKSSSKNELSYLRNIKIKPKIINIDKDNITRAEQLCLKTNQFNFTTKRYKIDEIKKLSKNHIAFLVDLKDIYGDHGLVSFVSLKEIKNFILIDTFIMSCRIIGRYLENWILNEIKKITLKKKKKVLIAQFKNTERNIIAKKFLEKNFKSLNKNLSKSLKKDKDNDYYEFDLNKKVINIEAYEKI